MNVWKILAIVFMVLFVLESSLIIWAWNEGNNLIEKELECAYDVCSGIEYYVFDDIYYTCECYDGDDLVKSKLLK